MLVCSHSKRLIWIKTQSSHSFSAESSDTVACGCTVLLSMHSKATVPGWKSLLELFVILSSASPSAADMSIKFVQTFQSVLHLLEHMFQFFSTFKQRHMTDFMQPAYLKTELTEVHIKSISHLWQDYIQIFQLKAFLCQPLWECAKHSLRWSDCLQSQHMG